MSKKFTEEEIKEALKQAEANIEMEEVKIDLEKEETNNESNNKHR